MRAFVDPSDSVITAVFTVGFTVMRLPILSLIAAGLVAAPALHAQSVVTETGTTYTTARLSSASTTGSAMAGMQVTATFADGEIVSGVWGDLGDELFGVSTQRFRLSLGAELNTGAPFDFLWSLDNLWSGGLTRLVLSGAPGGTVFDMNGDEVLTENSALGIALRLQGEDPFSPSRYDATATVTYRNAVALVGSSPMGDLFEQVDLLFGGASPLAAGTSVAFDLDTDTIGEGTTLDPQGGTGGGNGGGGGAPVSTVPEPTTVALLGGGLALLGGVRVRRRRTVTLG
ncbi:PEP-CTERM sorting domain-containing protein [Roseisolibacter agri]|uniref:Ice-binding protein C-terminal domain-containing protein n=1 Tax=Roseisolibacter agri TaxID=2014610 RepID=A0AA37Q4Z6_9BACT|nr:PEP-CTERM sorting domain-containing protein [Roseisolibacter agri]GLC23867.1 hypothetical protein rosag_03800 [Roseisolibacter agri]